MEVGARDMESGSLICVKRTGGDKFALPNDDDFGQAVAKQLEEMQAELLSAAEARLKAQTFEVERYDEMKEALEGSDASGAPGLFLVPWRDDAEAEAAIKTETKATIRCYPLDQQHRIDGKKCFYSGEPATHMAIFARAF